jgi:predicted transcriptional regulator
MNNNDLIKNKELYQKLDVLSNGLRFRILELTQQNSMSISKLSISLKLSYTKCADYVKMLENLKLVTKIKSGKEVLVKSNVIIHPNKLIFND